jgi:hypothetical protein
MGDVAAAAAAPSGGNNQVVIEPAAAAPQPLSNESTTGGGKGDVVEPKAPPTTREALRAAAERIGKDNPEDGTKPGDPKDLNKGAALARGERGQFTPKDGKQPTAADTAEAARVAAAAAATPEAKAAAAAAAAAKPGGDQASAAVKHAAPERFSPDAKASWEVAPEPVKAEVHRMQRELEAGIEKHRVGAQKYETVKDFDELASKNGTNLRTALTKYVNTEHLLRTNPLKGLEAICGNMGTSLRAVAEIVMGQTPDQQRSESDATIRDLNAKVARLEQQVGGVTQTFQQQQNDKVTDHVAAWSKDKPFFEILAPHIAEAMAGGASSLDDAYQGALAKFPELAAMAKAGKPASEDTTLAASTAAAEALAGQADKGRKSIAGARNGSGSDPVDQQRPTSIKDSLKRAAARV